MARVRLGYFEDFKSSDTLLLEADLEGLRALAEGLRALAAGIIEGIALHELPFVEIHHGVRLMARRATRDRGTRRAGSASTFLWERDAAGWSDAAERLDMLAEPAEGHHYLAADHDEVIVQVSKDEYGDRWWHTHG